MHAILMGILKNPIKISFSIIPEKLIWFMQWQKCIFFVTLRRFNRMGDIILTWVWRFHCFTSGALQYAMTTPSSSATAEFGQCRESALKTVNCWTMPISSRRPSQMSNKNRNWILSIRMKEKTQVRTIQLNNALI